MNRYIKNKIDTREKVSCVDPYCKKGLDDTITASFIGCPLGSQSMWDQHLVDTDPLVRYCPRNHVVRLQPNSWKIFMRCTECKIALCPKCGARNHPFQTCSGAARRRARREMANVRINLNLKHCPGCKIQGRFSLV